MAGPPAGTTRLLLGHESLSRVVDPGPAAGLKKGDLVPGTVRRPDPVPSPNCAVGEWDMCRNGQYTERGIKQIDGFMSERWRINPEYALKVDPSLARRGYRRGRGLSGAVFWGAARQGLEVRVKPREGKHDLDRTPDSTAQRAPLEDFSLVLGGPLYQLWRRLHLAGSALELLARRLIGIPLVAIPLFLLAEVIVHRRIGAVVPQFVDAGLVTPEVLTGFQAAIDRAMSLRNSLAVELILAVSVFGFGWLLWHEYSALAARYTREFQAKWIGGAAPPGEPLVGSGDIQSLADLANSYKVVQGMRAIPCRRDTVIQVALAALVPLAPLVLTVVPVGEILKQLLGMLL